MLKLSIEILSGMCQSAKRPLSQFDKLSKCFKIKMFQVNFDSKILSRIRLSFDFETNYNLLGLRITFNWHSTLIYQPIRK